MKNDEDKIAYVRRLIPDLNFENNGTARGILSKLLEEPFKIKSEDVEAVYAILWVAKINSMSKSSKAMTVKSLRQSEKIELIDLISTPSRESIRKRLHESGWEFMRFPVQRISFKSWVLNKDPIFFSYSKNSNVRKLDILEIDKIRARKVYIEPFINGEAKYSAYLYIKNKRCYIIIYNDKLNIIFDAAMSIVKINKENIQRRFTHGGIDLNAKNLKIDISREGAMDIKFDPILAREFKREDFVGINPVILHITPLTSLLYLWLFFRICG